MEIPVKKVVLQSFRTDIVSPEPGAEQQDESETGQSNQETPQPRTSPPTLAFIEFRIKNLNRRRQFLLQIQQFTKNTKDHHEHMAKGVISEDGGDLCELEAIQRELEELMTEKEAKQKQGKSSNKKGNGDPKSPPPLYYNPETPCGAIFILPPLQKTEEDVSAEQKIKTTPNPVGASGSMRSVNGLSQTTAAIRCPSCKEMIFPETRRTYGEAVWLLCCLCSMLGCFAGCCLVPFFIDRWKSVHHLCPLCKSHIHTSGPI